VATSQLPQKWGCDIGCQNLHVQFAISEQVFLMNKCHILASKIVSYGGKCHIVTSDVIFGVVGDMFHGTLIINGVYKVEVQGVTLRETTLFQPNFKDDLPQQLLKDVKGQITFWEDHANMQKTSS